MSRPTKRKDRPSRGRAPADSFVLHIDGAARGNPGPAGCGILISDKNGRAVREISAYIGEATNNVAETVALILGLQELLKLGARRAVVHTDSELLARQVGGDYRVKDRQLVWLHAIARPLIEGLEAFEIGHLPRERNKKADKLANKAVSDALRRQPPSARKAAPEPAPEQPSLFQ